MFFVQILSETEGGINVPRFTHSRAILQEAIRIPRGRPDPREDYARTLLEWQKRFESNIERARQLGGDERTRVWRIYLRVSRQGFESGFMSVYQVRASLPATV